MRASPVAVGWTPDGWRNPYCSHGPIDQGPHLYCPYSHEQEYFCRLGPVVFEAFFGGAAGPGKTITLLAEGTQQLHIPGYRAIFFRRSYPELEQAMDIAAEIFPHVLPQVGGGKWHGGSHTWSWKTGSSYRFAYCERDRDRFRYQGGAWQYIAWDELTQWSNDLVYTYLFTRCRPFKMGTNVYCCVRSASNPGGPGHGWVKERFIEHTKPFERRKIMTPTGRTYDRVYIPATLDTNDLLLNADNRAYETALMAVPDPELRRAMRFGDWDVLSGVMFSELRPLVHQVVASAPLPWSDRMIVMDWGFEHQACCLWIESDPLQSPARSRVYREYVINQLVPPLFAQQVISRCAGENIRRAVLDSAAWGTPQDGGPSPAEQMQPIFQQAGIHLEPTSKKPSAAGDTFRVHGWQLLHTYFSPHRDGGPLLRISEDCPILWRQLTTLQRGEPPANVEDTAKGQTDDAATTLRYWASSRPEPPSPTPAEIMRAMVDETFGRDPRTLQAAQLERAHLKRLMAVRDIPRRKTGRRARPWEGPWKPKS